MKNWTEKTSLMSAASKDFSEAHDKYRTNPDFFFFYRNRALNGSEIPAPVRGGNETAQMLDESQKNLTSGEGQINIQHF